MITDAIISVVYGLVSALRDLLPDAPERLDAIDNMLWVARSVDYLLPVTEIVSFMGVVAIVYGAFLVWRIVRALNPLGS